MPNQVEVTLAFPTVRPTPSATKRKERPDDCDIESKPSPQKASRERKHVVDRSSSTVPPTSMTADIKEALVDHMMRIALANVDKDKLSEQLGITKKQLDNAICSGRTNLRSKLIKAARDL